MATDVMNDTTPVETKQEKKKFFPAPEVESMAKKLIGKYHGFLREAKISYVFKDATWNKDGKPCAGEVKLMSPYVHVLTGFDFGVIINYKYWLQLDTKLREAILDHLLSSCTADEDKEGNFKWKKAKPSVNEFPEVIERHGAYTEDLKNLDDALAEYNNKQNG